MREVVFRVDASTRIGTGHVVRCLTLADELGSRGVRCRFIHRVLPGHMSDAIRSRGHDLVELPEPPEHYASAADGDYATWLGVSLEEDVEQSVSAMVGEKPDWLVVDHYALDQRWESRLRPLTKRIAVIDDLANRVHEADVLLDQNYSTGETDRYRNLLPRHASRLFGPAYALLHPAYAGYRQRTRPWNGIVERVLIFFGGSDPDNMTGMALESLSSQELQELSVDVIVGANNPHRSSIELLAQKRPGTTLYGPRPHLADLMAKADLGLGAGGVTTWERCCLGLPSLLVSIAENQRPACESLARDGLICYAGHWDGVTAEKLNAILMELIRDPVALRQMASSCLALVDGQGTSRVADHLAC